MKKAIFLLLPLLIILISEISATIWQVSNQHSAADFAWLQDAVNAASSGDTIYVGGSPNAQGDATINKKLTIIGVGFWLDENDTTQAYKEPSRIGRLTFNPGSEGSLIEGLYLYFKGGGWTLIVVNTDSITIQKNYIKGFMDGGWYDGGNVIYINGDRNNITVQQNYISSQIYNSHNSTVFCIYVSGIPNNLIIRHNLIDSFNSGGEGGFYSIYMNNDNYAFDSFLYNNVIWGNMQTYYTVHTNNILVSDNYSLGYGDSAYNNLCNGTQYPDNNNNHLNIDMSNVFIDYVKYIDNGYFLAPGSPALGAGLNGGDCGVFDNGLGGQPYVLSGMPAIPAIFEATIETTGTTSIPGTIKATSHN